MSCLLLLHLRLLENISDFPHILVKLPAADCCCAWQYQDADEKRRRRSILRDSKWQTNKIDIEMTARCMHLLYYNSLTHILTYTETYDTLVCYVCTPLKKLFLAACCCCIPRTLPLKKHDFLSLLTSLDKQWTEKKDERNKFSISFHHKPNYNFIKLLWDAANRHQALWNRRIVRQSKKCGYRRHLFCHRQHRLMLHNKRKFRNANWSMENCFSHLPFPVVETTTSLVTRYRNLGYSPKSSHHLRRDSNTERTRITDSPGSMSPSVHSSDERPRSRITSHTSRPTSQPSRNGN